MDHSFTYLGNAYYDGISLDETCSDAVCVVDQLQLSKLGYDTKAYALVFV